MPFTLAHPSIIFPLENTKFKLSVTALVTGSMVPDFEFFFQMREVDNIGHHWYGIILFDIPVAFILCFLFHNLIKEAFVANLPARYQKRCIPVLEINWNNYVSDNKLRVTVSILIGIASHIFLDGFTHADGFFVSIAPVLLKNIYLFSYAMPVYYLLQIAFSIIGLLIVYQKIAAMPEVEANNSLTQKNKLYWPAFIITLLAILLTRLSIWPEFNSFWGVFMAVMGGITYSWILISLVFKNKFQIINN